MRRHLWQPRPLRHPLDRVLPYFSCLELLRVDLVFWQLRHCFAHPCTRVLLGFAMRPVLRHSRHRRLRHSPRLLPESCQRLLELWPLVSLEFVIVRYCYPHAYCL